MTLVVDCERLFDGRELLPGGARVTVEGTRITAVEPGKQPEPAAAEARRLSCRFAMPGLIDSHLHVAGYLEGPPAGRPFKPVKDFLRLLILNGVTTVRDTGNAIETILYAREWSERYSGPRIFAAGPLLDVPPLMWPFSRIVRDTAAARRQVELLAAEGMDFVKSYRNVTTEVLATLVDTARAHGLDVAADVHAATALDACRLGVHSLEHAANLCDERTLQISGAGYAGAQGRARLWSQIDLDGPVVEALIRELKAHGTFVCPTLLVSHRWCDLEAMVHEPYLDYMVAIMPYHQHFKRMQSAIGMAIGRRFVERYLKVPKPNKKEKGEIDAGLARIRAMVARLHAAGVRIAVGTDAPNPSIVPGFSLHQEMALLVDAGLPAAAVLSYATAGGAELLRRDDLGAVRPGALADLLLLDGDPTVDIHQTRNIHTVIKNGEPVDAEHILEKFKESLEDQR